MEKILFFIPDYHSSFALRDSLRAKGHKCDIYVPCDYPPNLLWSETDLIRPWRYNQKVFNKTSDKNFITRVFFKIFYASLNLIFELKTCLKYDVIYQYGRPSLSTRLVIRLIKSMHKIYLYLPSGCRDEDSKKNWSNYDSGQVCGNCGFASKCNDRKNLKNANFINKNSNAIILGGSKDSTILNNQVHIKSKAIYLNIWNPNLTIPEQHLLPETNKVRILHSHSLQSRTFQNKNIKGTPLILREIEALIAEGYPIEYLNVTDVKSNEIIYLQAQCDIAVDQLHYGWFGSTTLELLALGKPVICYLREEFKENFFKHFPEFKDDFPVVSSTKKELRNKILELVMNKSTRIDLGNKSRLFAERFLDADENSAELLKIIRRL